MLSFQVCERKTEENQANVPQYIYYKPFMIHPEVETYHSKSSLIKLVISDQSLEASQSSQAAERLWKLWATENTYTSV